MRSTPAEGSAYLSKEACHERWIVALLVFPSKSSCGVDRRRTVFLAGSYSRSRSWLTHFLHFPWNPGLLFLDIIGGSDLKSYITRSPVPHKLSSCPSSPSPSTKKQLQEKKLFQTSPSSPSIVKFGGRRAKAKCTAPLGRSANWIPVRKIFLDISALSL